MLCYVTYYNFKYQAILHHSFCNIDKCVDPERYDVDHVQRRKEEYETLYPFTVIIASN